MKSRALAAIVFSLSISMLAPLAHAQTPTQPRGPKQLPFQGVGGRDISQSGWQNWQAPVGTVDPGRLLPSDSTDSTVNAELAQLHPDSSKAGSSPLASSLGGGKPIQVEAEPIEPSGGKSADSVAQTAPALAAAAPKPKRGSTRVVIIAAACVAAFAYRKFRRANASPYPPKPNFL